MLLEGELLGIFITIGAYLLGVKVRNKFKFQLFNPVLVASVVIIVLLLVLKIPYETYMNGAEQISFFIGPATVALALPLYRYRQVLYDNFFPVIVGIFCGSLAAAGSTLLLCKVFGLSQEIGISLLPHCVTTAIASDLSATYGGIESLTVASVIFTGTGGAIIAPMIFDSLKMKDNVARGLSMGTISHAIGTARAMELDGSQGAMSSLSIAIAGVIVTLLMPFAASLVSMIL